MAFNFVRSCAALFSAPLTLIVVQAFIFKDNGLYGFVLFGVLVIAAIVQVILNRKMSETQNEKIRIMGRRISTNLELFTSVR
jgi:ABC-type multidrug transport system fused ATPase/permease subunit